MMRLTHVQKIGALASLIGLCFALAGCLLTPGHFTSSLDIRRDGAFTYHYSGEIKVLGLVELARFAAQQRSANDNFMPHCWGKSPATGPSTAHPTFLPRSAVTVLPPPPVPAGPQPCTDAEISQQRKQWENMRQTGEDNTKRQQQQMAAILGGIDPTSPGAAEELAARLRRQAGWSRVDYKGSGVFEVEFSTTGRLTHDFAFPMVEKMPAAAPFVTVYRHTDGTLRVDAPGFVGGAGNQLTTAMLAMSSNGEAAPSGSGLPMVDGHFSLTTDAAILANNTDEGPQPNPQGQRLDWTVTPRTQAAPSALLRLSPIAR